MAKKNVRRAVVDKWKKKKTFTIIAPKLLNSIEVGHTVADKEEKLIGRVAKYNLGLLLNKYSVRGFNAHMKINKVEGLNAYTEMKAIEIKNNYSRRLVGRRCDKIESVIFLNSKDNHKVKVKIMATTVRKQEAAKKKDIRKKLNEEVELLLKENNIADVFHKVIFDDFAKKLIPKIKNIAALRSCTITEITDLSV